MLTKLFNLPTNTIQKFADLCGTVKLFTKLEVYGYNHYLFLTRTTYSGIHMHVRTFLYFYRIKDSYKVRLFRGTTMNTKFLEIMNKGEFTSVEDLKDQLIKEFFKLAEFPDALVPTFRGVIFESDPRIINMSIEHFLVWIQRMSEKIETMKEDFKGAFQNEAQNKA